MAVPADARLGSVEVIYRDSDGTELMRRTMRGVTMLLETRHVLPTDPDETPVPADTPDAIEQVRPVISGIWTEAPQ